MALTILAVHALDLAATLAVIGAYGVGAEVNPAMRAALALGPLGGVAAKAALLAVILAAAALGPRYRRLLLGGALVVGCLGAASGFVAL
jgi:hypothetical protein